VGARATAPRAPRKPRKQKCGQQHRQRQAQVIPSAHACHRSEKAGFMHTKAKLKHKVQSIKGKRRKGCKRPPKRPSIKTKTKTKHNNNNKIETGSSFVERLVQFLLRFCPPILWFWAKTNPLRLKKDGTCPTFGGLWRPNQPTSCLPKSAPCFVKYSAKMAGQFQALKGLVACNACQAPPPGCPCHEPSARAAPRFCLFGPPNPPPSRARAERAEKGRYVPDLWRTVASEPAHLLSLKKRALFCQVFS
jgi:hypothetical protein